jgi:hypothetical protein
MNTFIKQYSTIPLLVYPLKESVLKKYYIIDDMFESVAVTFSMFDIENNTFVIANKQAELRVIDDKVERGLNGDSKYNLVYRFTEKDTRKVGVYYGEFVVDFMGFMGCGKMRFPLNDAETIKIIIDESITKTTII